jgi:hypothetical protein
MKTEKFDKQNLSALRQEINAALKSVAEKYGINVNCGNARFMASTATFKLELATIGENGAATSPHAESFKAIGKLYGFESSDLGRSFLSNGSEFVITGLNTKCARFPVCASRVPDGRGFKFPTDAILAKLGRKVQFGMNVTV